MQKKTESSLTPLETSSMPSRLTTSLERVQREPMTERGRQMTKCEACKSWQIVGNYGPLSDDEEIGECRRRSPAPASGQQHQLMQMLRVIALSAAKTSGLDATHQPEVDDAAIPAFSAVYNDLHQPAGWPVTLADAWCGEFEKRADRTEHG